MAVAVVATAAAAAVAAAAAAQPPAAPGAAGLRCKLAPGGPAPLPQPLPPFSLSLRLLLLLLPQLLAPLLASLWLARHAPQLQTPWPPATIPVQFQGHPARILVDHSFRSLWYSCTTEQTRSTFTIKRLWRGRVPRHAPGSPPLPHSHAVPRFELQAQGRSNASRRARARQCRRRHL
eukprot:COSAG05_NODE_50_length_24118_cov_89.534036_22_plen_177_part_00